ncbi:MAG: phospho-N-acetylmuramoyl-pentapeptide-transferase [Phycisphaera sp.]|nr:phospho-N-acetylmuramoyl-pentapeptide-transferase [Phycisphaera sp.]
MLYHFILYLADFLKAHGLYGFVRPFTFAEFRAVMAIILSFAIVTLLGKRTVRTLLKLKVGDAPEFFHKDLNVLMKDKKNTPTMGGVLIVGAIFTCAVLLADIGSFYVQMALICLVCLAVLGGFDDYLKLTAARRKPGSRQGLFSGEKFLFQLGLAVVLGLFIHHYGITKPTTIEDLSVRAQFEHFREMSHCLNLPFIKAWTYDPNLKDYVPSPVLVKYLTLGPWAFVLLSIFVIAGSSNAVNLTDGMDGLASGIMIVVAFAFMILALIAGRPDAAKFLLVPYIPYSDELAILAGAVVGSCLGFLWFNCNPAQVFMGDTGSLALGGLLGYIAVVIRQEFLLIVIGGVFVMEALSVILQVGYFKMSSGKRIFRCAPIHHHFHLGGWTEQQVVVRFWIISAILAAVALATIRLR